MKNIYSIIVILFLWGCSGDIQDEKTDLGSDSGHQKSDTDINDVGSDTADLGNSEKDLHESDMSDMGTKNTIFENGPYHVGYRSWSFKYDAKGQKDRELRLAVWYPTDDVKGKSARYYNLITRSKIFKGATVAEGKFPLLVFSHGNGSFAEQSFFFTEYLTSHGFVVIAPDHSGNTFRDGGGVKFDSAGLRPQDVSASLDEIQNLANDDALFGKLTAQIAMAGHSFGGFTTLAATGASFDVDSIIQACDAGTYPASLCALFSDEKKEVFRAGFLDKRIKVAIPMTPAGAAIFGDGISKIKIPTLLFTGGQDRTLTNPAEGDPIWARLNKPASRVDITKAGHFTFSNMCLLGGGIEKVQNDGCSDEFIPYEEAFEIIKAYSMAYLQKHLLGNSEYDDFLANPEPFNDDITLSQKP